MEREVTTGLVYGNNAGYDFELSPGSPLGIEGSYEWSDNERCEALFGSDEACFALKRNRYVGVRGGAQLGKTTLLFSGLGYTNGRARISYTDPAVPADNFTVADDREGWCASLGLEQSFGTNLFGKVDYRYSNIRTSIAPMVPKASPSASSATKLSPASVCGSDQAGANVTRWPLARYLPPNVNLDEANHSIPHRSVHALDVYADAKLRGSRNKVARQALNS